MTRIFAVSLLLLSVTPLHAQESPEDLKKENAALRAKVSGLEKDLQSVRRRCETEEGRVKVLTEDVLQTRELLHGDGQVGLSSARSSFYRSALLEPAHQALRACAEVSSRWSPEDAKAMDLLWKLKKASQGGPRTNFVQTASDLLLTAQLLPILEKDAFERQATQRDEVTSLRKQFQAFRTEKQGEIDQLRTRLNHSDDLALTHARTSDREKRRLQDESQQLQDQLARLNRDHALVVARLESEKAQRDQTIAELRRAGAQRQRVLEARLLATLDRQLVSLELKDAHVRVALGALGDACGVRHVIDQADLAKVAGKTVTLKAENLSVRALQDAVAKRLGLTWRHDGELVRFEAR